MLATNALGWGAFVGVGLRRHGLTRYRRGTQADILALPALFVDLDDLSPSALKRLQNLKPKPSCITVTGGGYHAYWWLNQPLTDMTLARHLLRGLQRAAHSDPLSPAQCLRLVRSRNTKPHRSNTLCEVVELHELHYIPEDFAHLLPHPTRPKHRQTYTTSLNTDTLQAVTDAFLHMGYVQRGDWLSGPCIHPERHRHDDRHHSFGFNTRTGYGNCFRCGSMLLKDICTELGIQSTDYNMLFNIQ